MCVTHVGQLLRTGFCAKAGLLAVSEGRKGNANHAAERDKEQKQNPFRITHLRCAASIAKAMDWSRRRVRLPWLHRKRPYRDRQIGNAAQKLSRLTFGIRQPA